MRLCKKNNNYNFENICTPAVLRSYENVLFQYISSRKLNLNCRRIGKMKMRMR